MTSTQARARNFIKKAEQAKSNQACTVLRRSPRKMKKLCYGTKGRPSEFRHMMWITAKYLSGSRLTFSDNGVIGLDYETQDPARTIIGLVQQVYPSVVAKEFFEFKMQDGTN